MGPAAAAITGAAIQGGSSIGGALISAHHQRKMHEQNIELQREFAQQGIQWRVADAKAAGLHPLYALGASTSGPTVPVMADPIGPAIASAGQAVGRAVAAQETPGQLAAQAAALEVARSQTAKNDAEAAYFLSEAARRRQLPTAPFPDVGATDPNVMFNPDIVKRQQLFGGGAAADIVKTEPATSTSYSSSDSSVAAAKDIGWKFFKLDDSGRGMFLPNAQNMGEALESVSESYLLAYLVARENMKRQPNWLRDNAHWFPYGEELLHRWSQGEALWDDRMQRKHAADAPDVSHGRAAQSRGHRYRGR